MMEDTSGDSIILATDRVSDAISLIAKRPNSALAVTTAEGTLSGIVTEKDIILALHELGPQALDAAIETVMTKNPITCDAEDTCEKVLTTMIRGNFRNIPINKNNKLDLNTKLFLVFVFLIGIFSILFYNKRNGFHRMFGKI